MMMYRVLALVLAFQCAFGQHQVVDVHLEEAVGRSAGGLGETRGMRRANLRPEADPQVRQRLDAVFGGWKAQSAQIWKLHRSVAEQI